MPTEVIALPGSIAGRGAPPRGGEPGLPDADRPSVARLPSPARRIRTERLIAAGRTALAAVSLLALAIDPSDPAVRAGTVETLVAAYLAYALLALLTAWVAAGRLLRLGIALQAVDLAVASGLVALGGGSESPFFGYLVFALVTAALRWPRPGVLWTAVAALAVLAGLGLSRGVVPTDPHFAPGGRFILAAGCLAAVAVLIASLDTRGWEPRELVRQAQEAAVTQERVRLARDLHDGVMQSLGGAALRLETARRLLARDPAAAERLLVEVQDLLAFEQKELRSILRAPGLRGLDGPVRGEELETRLEELSRRIEQSWELAVRLSVDLLGTAISPSLAHEIDHIVHEALVNAVRHGGAAAAEVVVGLDGTAVRITVRDDGRGFPFRGDYDFATLKALKIGPVTLKQRIAEAGGTLRIRSTEAGAHLEIGLPLR